MPHHSKLYTLKLFRPSTGPVTRLVIAQSVDDVMKYAVPDGYEIHEVRLSDTALLVVS